MTTILFMWLHGFMPITTVCPMWTDYRPRMECRTVVDVSWYFL